jgi:hypothetical protein
MTDCEWMKMSCLFYEVLFANKIYSLFFIVLLWMNKGNRNSKLCYFMDFEAGLDFLGIKFVAKIKVCSIELLLLLKFHS